ncbi:Dynein light intermediate chain axonemal [Fasciolopsis buskii]|uniref:Dynein light intermediate chain axonemal n=1 Tax=Fasciolopsis buskii TaxID=27845 RepID=A0A8E0VIS5_9TREM|nr:Dynein light intermediate chain axonemal [Fasciolopsis buski]
MHTLLKYDNGIPEDDEEEDLCDAHKASRKRLATYCSLSEGSMITCTGVSGMIVTNSLAKDETVAKTLAHLFHPIHFKESGNKYVKHISMKQATPIELKNLETEVDRLLESRASRRVPLCDIRRDVLEDLADEILRQITIECPEQGVLLKRILNHHQTEFQAYETLLEFSESFVGRKRILWNHWKKARVKKIQELEEAKRILEYQLAELKHKVDQLEKKNQEAKVKRDAARQEEIKFYKKRAEHLKVSLYINLVSSPKHKKTNANSIHVL